MNEEKTTAVLYRNNISAVILSDMLSKAGISYKLKGFKKQFFEHWMIDDMFSIINVVLNNKDIVSFEKIYYKLGGYYISKDMINEIKKINKDTTIFEKLSCLDLEDYQEKNIEQLRIDFKLLSHQKFENMFDYIEHCLNYKQITTSNRAVLETLKYLARGLNSVDEIKNKLNSLKNYMQESIFNKDENPVILSTSHSSKGLEWDIVYVIDVINGTFPTNSSIKALSLNEPEEMEEERRLFYVSMTRAKTDLTLYELMVTNSLFIDEVKDSMNKVYKKSVDCNKIENPNNQTTIQETFNNVDIPELKNALTRHKNNDVFIRHKKLGIGLVKNFNDGNIEILFNNDLLKTLSFDFCCKNNLIKLNKG